MMTTTAKRSSRMETKNSPTTGFSNMEVTSNRSSFRQLKSDKSRFKRLGKENRDGGYGRVWSLMQKATKEREQ